MITGTVKFYNSTKGFGFITPETGGKDAFVHVTALERAGISGLADGQKVTYDVQAATDASPPTCARLTLRGRLHARTFPRAPCSTATKSARWSCAPRRGTATRRPLRGPRLPAARSRPLLYRVQSIVERNARVVEKLT